MLGSCFANPYSSLFYAKVDLTVYVSGAVIGPTSAVVDGFRNEPDRKFA